MSFKYNRSSLLVFVFIEEKNMSDLPTSTLQRNLLEKIFLSPEESRLRAGWRLLIHTILFILLTICLATPIALVMLVPDNGFDPKRVGFLLLNQVAMVFGVTTATFLCRRLIDRRPITSLGLKVNAWALYDLLAGIVVAFFAMGFIYLIELTLGWTRFDGFSWQTEGTPVVASSILIWLAVFLLVGWSEELLSRGYHLQNIADGLNIFWAVLISSSIFGILHINNPDASWISTVGIILAGFFLALPYLLTHQLWMSIGLHIGWNFFEGVVFGFPVSGLETYNLIQHTVTGPELWTGGDFGPEAGLLVLPAMLIGSALTYGYAQFQKHSSQPRRLNEG